MIDDDEHDELVEALQDVMLPAGIPVLPEVDLAARYCLPSDDEEGTGNFFDVVVLDDGRLGLVLGETVGSGVAAVAAMGQVRAILRAGLQHHGDPVAAIGLADAFAAHSPDARGAAAVVAVLDTEAGLLRYTTAGHPAPVVVDPGGQARQLERGGAGWLGTGATYDAIEHQVGRGGAVLLVCTSAEQHSRDLPAALMRARVPDEPDATCAHLQAELARHANATLTLLLVEVRESERAGFELELPAGALSTRAARERLAQWLESFQAPAMGAMSIVHSCAELVSNAVEHAYGTGAGRGSHGADPVRVTATLTPVGDVRIEVLDHGSWRVSAEDDPARGRGLAMAAGLVDHLSVTTDDHGTHAVLTHRLTRPVPIQHGPHPSATLPVRSVAIELEQPGEVALRGSFGHDDVERVSAELLMASRGGTRDLRVDLTGVTHLASSALRMLSDMATAEGAEVHLLAHDESPPQRLLSAAQVPHEIA